MNINERTEADLKLKDIEYNVKVEYIYIYIYIYIAEKVCGTFARIRDCCKFNIKR